MAHFEKLISVEKVKVRPKGIWKLNRELIYHSDIVGMIIVPKDFRTDFASVPRFPPIAYALVGGKADEAAAVHDLLYTGQIFNRELCDKIFEEAIRSLGYSSATASLMYTGVRVGGWYTWNLPNVPQFRDVAEQLDIPEVLNYPKNSPA